MKATFSIAALLTTLGVVAQEPVLVRAADHIVFRMQGPARMAGGFRATNVGTALASRDAGEFLDYCRSAFRGGLGELDEEVGPKIADLLVSLDAYAGEVTVGVDFTPHPEAWAGIAPDAGGAVVLEPDGSTDLAALAARVRETLRGTRWKIEDVEFAGRTLPLIRTGERSGVVLPTMIGDRLCAFFGEDIRGNVERRLGTDAAAFVPDEDLRRAAFGVRVDVQPLVALQMLDPAFEISSTSKVDVARATGVASMREFRATVRPIGPYVAIDTSIAFLPGVPRGLFAGFLPDSAEPPQLAWLVPTETRNWMAGKLRLDLAVAATIDIAASWTKTADEPLERVAERMREQLRAFTGVDLDKDLFAHLTGDCLLIGGFTAPQHEDPDAAGSAIGATDESALLAFAVRDAAAFRAGLDGFRKSDLWSFVGELQSTTHEDVELWENDDLSAALVDGLFVVGLGDSGADWLRSFLTHRARLTKNAADPHALPREIERRRRQAPAGLQGFGQIEFDSAFGGVLLELLGAQGLDVLELDVGTLDGLARLRPLFEERGLNRLVGMTGWADGRWTCRVLW